MLNPFFLQGSPSEQNLVQDLINEHLRMFGVEVFYMPRRYLTEKTITKEVIESKFDHAFPIEAYVANYQGYAENSDILSKFGFSSGDELTLIISKERYQLYIQALLKDHQKMKLVTRPKEGDLVFFPLGGKLFEIKFVETEKPFYQLGKNYTYELRCELFEYEDETIVTGVDIIDEVVENEGYIATLTLTGIGSTATAITSISAGGIQSIKLLNDGNGYLSAPQVKISPPTGGGTTATAVATVRSKSGYTTAYSIADVYITNPGSGYTFAPSIVFLGGGGSGAAATVGISTYSGSVGIITITFGGSGYTTSPSITFSSPPNVSYAVTATGIPIVSSAGTISQIRIINAGVGYTQTPIITISAPSLVGIGTFIFNETVVGSGNSTTARVKDWNAITSKLKVGIVTGYFGIGQTITGETSGAKYTINNVETFNVIDSYAENDVLESEGDVIVDFTEKNPFGEI